MVSRFRSMFPSYFLQWCLLSKTPVSLLSSGTSFENLNGSLILSTVVGWDNVFYPSSTDSDSYPGHLSQVNATVPLQIFISPLYPVNDREQQSRQNPRAMASEAMNALAPPVYGDHRLDQLYVDFDRSGYDTPGPLSSGAATPLSSSSRNASIEDLASMDTIANSNGTACALQSRLSSLSVGDSAHNPSQGE